MAPLQQEQEHPIEEEGHHDGIQLLGSAKGMGMALMPPPPTKENTHPVISILQQIDALLQQDSIQQALSQWKQDDSARHIQGNRMEIFLRADDKSSLFFDSILAPHLPPHAKEQVLDYAQQQALRDPRLNDSYQFGNFSLLVNAAASPAQAPHIDLILPNFQFGLIVSEGADGTLFWESDQHIQSVEDLQNRFWNDMPEGLVRAMKKEDTVRVLLKFFGDVLLPDLPRGAIQKRNLPTGTVLSLPGGVVHAGPSSDGFRTVLFFSGWQQGSVIEAYDPDVQYMAPTLIGNFVSLLWHDDGMGFEERYYLLQRLADYTERAGVEGLWGHFRNEKLANFVGNIEEHGYVGVFEREVYIAKVAHELSFLSEEDPATGSEWVLDKTQFRQVSVDPLYTLWNNTLECRVVLYQHIATGRLIVRYPNENGNLQEDEYEGLREGEIFTLNMTDDEEALFDGTNGTLLDRKGKARKMYTK